MSLFSVYMVVLFSQIKDLFKRRYCLWRESFKIFTFRGRMETKIFDCPCSNLLQQFKYNQCHILKKETPLESLIRWVLHFNYNQPEGFGFVSFYLSHLFQPVNAETIV
ncbi:monocarboxylate transporter 8 [Platysternon megacephalum]|uniref:Monocarboxylate transporter 8 n=1 Tax=Platysternon megacephalum TaxID=55544 RepID=A0A4D9EV91_9SAUR|nr:monocarboxylate transporter 8 [Platysternon megacephalum]